ncbi:MAG TPA: HEAT repeat domain-containing protein [Bryobacteraceae bacterium]|nr:HEAT repeat domain-containing protein [Bryobacteraceae bacterium]
MKVPSSFVIPIFALLTAATLSAQPEKTAWDVLKQGLADTNPLNRRQAVTATGSVGLDPEAIRYVEEALKSDKDSLIRATAAAELGEMKSRQSIPALRAALDDPAGEVGYAAARALWSMGDKTGRGFIEDVIAGQQQATDGGVKGAMHRADRLRHDPKQMAILGAKSASGALLGPFNIGVVAAEQVFKGGAVAVRMEALNLLAEDCDAQTFKLLQAASINDQTWAEKATAAKALGRCGNPDAIPTLEQNLSKSNVAVRYMSAGAIIRLSHKPEGSASVLH